MAYKVEEYKGVTRIIEVRPDELNLDKTLKCGQAFRWNKTKNGTWYGTIGQKLVALTPGFFTDGKYGIATNLSIDETGLLINYFDLSTNYNEELSKLNLDEYAKKAWRHGEGIKILRQELFETMVTFLMSQCNTMHNIKLIVDKLSERYGNKEEIEWLGEHLVYYTFPTLPQLSECSYKDFTNCGMGFRAQYLLSMVKYINANEGILNKIKNCGRDEAISILKTFDGIGDKVANCISLFALHHIDAFPVDVHIKRIIDREYNGDIDITKYSPYAGLIQQYMFYYEAFKQKER